MDSSDDLELMGLFSNETRCGDFCRALSEDVIESLAVDVPVTCCAELPTPTAGVGRDTPEGHTSYAESLDS